MFWEMLYSSVVDNFRHRQGESGEQEHSGIQHQALAKPWEQEVTGTSELGPAGGRVGHRRAQPVGRGH